MEIITNNVTETLIGLLALAGELPEDISLSEVTKKVFRKCILKCKKEMLIKIDTNHQRIRLRSPKGIEFLRDMSEQLYTHYMMITNNHQFTHTPRAQKLYYTLRESVLFAIRNGYPVDNILIRHIPNKFGLNSKEDEFDFVGGGIMNLGSNRFCIDGDVLPIMDSASCVSVNEKRYFTARYIKHGRPTTDRLNLSRISGVMLSEENIYAVYLIDEVKKISDPEAIMARLLYEIYRNAYNKSISKASAIFVTNTIPSKATKADSIFRECFFIPNNADGDFVIKILGTRNWKEKLRTALYGENVRSPYDGIYEGIPSYELITGNYNKIRDAKKMAPNKRINFMCMEWQLPIIKKLARGMDYTIQTLTEEQKTILLDYIQEEQK